MFRTIGSLVILALLGIQCQAGILGNLLTHNGIQDTLQASTSRVNIIDQDGSNGFSFGDVMYGFVGFSGVVTDDDPLGTGSFTPVAPNSMAAVFAAEITGFSGGVYTFGTVSNSDLQLKSLVNSTIGSSLSTTSIFAVVSKVTTISTVANFAQFKETGLTSRGVGQNFTTAAYGSTAPNGLSNFGAGWGVELYGGLDGANDSLVFDTFNNTQSGAFSINSPAPGLPGVLFVPVPTVTTPYGVPSAVLADIALNLTHVQASTFGTSPNGWGYTANDATFTLNTVPEPGSLVTFAGIALASIAGLRRRRK